MFLTIQGVRGSRRAALYHVVQARESPSPWLSVGYVTMKRTSRIGGMLVAVGVTFWCGSPRSVVLAQEGKTALETRAGDKEPAGKGEKGLPRISLLSLQVTRPLPAAANMPPGMLPPRRFGVQRFGMPQAPGEGTTLTFLVEEPQQSMLGLEMKDCKITRFCDEKDTDLTKAKDPQEQGDVPRIPGAEPETFSFSGDLDPDGHRATITVHSPLFPASGANRLLLDAELVVRYGRGEKVIEQKDVNLKADKLTVSPIPMLVMKQDPGFMGPGQQNRAQVVLYHLGPLREIKKIAFFDSDGQEIKSTQSGSGQNGSNNFQEYYSLEKNVETCTVRFTVPEKIETVTTAVSINTGIGFPPFVRRRVVDSPAQGQQAKGQAPR
jgi:hypothetical protein